MLVRRYPDRATVGRALAAWAEEFARAAAEDSRFGRVLREETDWIVGG